MAKSPSAPKPTASEVPMLPHTIPATSAPKPTAPEAPKKQSFLGRLKEDTKEVWDHGRDAIGGMFG